MNSLSRNELIKALVKGLKLDDNIFNYQAVDEETEFIQDKDFMDFFKAVMSAETYGNGLKAIIEVAEQFKPIVHDNLRAEAKRLIQLVEAINHQVFKDSEKMSVQFDKLIKFLSIEKMNLSDSDIIVLNQVKPYQDIKFLVSRINEYANSEAQLKAFMSALEYTPSEVVQIANPLQKLRLKR